MLKVATTGRETWRRALAAWMPERGCGGTLVPAHSRRLRCLSPSRLRHSRVDGPALAPHATGGVARRQRLRLAGCLSPTLAPTLTLTLTLVPIPYPLALALTRCARAVPLQAARRHRAQRQRCAAHRGRRGLRAHQVRSGALGGAAPDDAAAVVGPRLRQQYQCRGARGHRGTFRRRHFSLRHFRPRHLRRLHFRLRHEGYATTIGRCTSVHPLRCARASRHR